MTWLRWARGKTKRPALRRFSGKLYGMLYSCVMQHAGFGERRLVCCGNGEKRAVADKARLNSRHPHRAKVYQEYPPVIVVDQCRMLP